MNSFTCISSEFWIWFYIKTYTSKIDRCIQTRPSLPQDHAWKQSRMVSPPPAHTHDWWFISKYNCWENWVMSKHTNLSIINYLVILVVHDHNHGVVVHGLAFEKYVQLVSHCSHWRFNFGFWYILLTNKELKVLETPQNILHVAIDVLLEGVHLVCPAVALEVGDDLLHVVLQVHSVVLLGPKARLGETVVEHDVDPTGKEYWVKCDRSQYILAAATHLRRRCYGHQ